ncbi:RidA family protein [Hymenobacter sp. HMF4947]|uniref:RidA family protein n=1 Tax=Hymenobacter ginkgonis TaxID=2682976 RepID=A0A7K1TF58_9BACT|nr:RidA family protein [Hymenobacter ginkgonis]MVN77049.1 RidA family protein [Hymenobacter ginkgonis]
MEKKAVNPGKWQDDFSFSQAVEVSNNSQTLFCAGQASINEEGQPLHKGDMAAQLTLAFENLEAVLVKGNYGLTNIVRLLIYTTDFDNLFQHYSMLAAKLENTTPKPTVTIIGVNRLVFPELLVEIEAIAVK